MLATKRSGQQSASSGQQLKTIKMSPSPCSFEFRLPCNCCVESDRVCVLLSYCA
jgi:hypothetical protein